MRKQFTLLLLLLLCAVWAGAQGREVNGKVTDSAGNAISAATIRIKGFKKGVSATSDGSFKINVPPNSVLIVSAVGFEPQEVDVTNTTNADIHLHAAGSRMLNEVVVTALGIRREKRDLTYSAQEVKGETLVAAKQDNIVNALAGKVSGVQVTNSTGMPGSSSRIVIRGATSLVGENQPLFIVDGIPIDNSEAGAIDAFGQGADNVSLNQGSTSNRGIDIDPNIIETMTVLKGAAATGALRLGRGKRRDHHHNENRLQSGQAPADRQQQRQYEQTHLPGDAGQIRPGLQRTVHRRQQRPVRVQLPGTPHRHAEGQRRPGSQTQPAKEFFRTGYTYDNNINVTGATDKSRYVLSYSYLKTDGIMPHTDFTRHSVFGKFSNQITSTLTATFQVNYVNSVNNRIEEGNGLSSPLWTVYAAPISWNPLPTTNPDGTQRLYRTGRNNPYFILDNTGFVSTINRFLPVTTLVYTPLPWLSFTERLGADIYTDESSYHESNQIVNGYFFNNGGVSNRTQNFRQFNNDLIAEAHKNITEDLYGSITIGMNIFSQYSRFYTQTGLGQTIDNFYNVATMSVQNATDNLSRYRKVGYYAQANLEYRKMLILGLTGRYDGSSVLAAAKHYYPYGSASFGFIFSELMSPNTPLSFGKIKLSYSAVGNDNLLPYSLTTPFVPATGTANNINYPFNGQTAFVLTNILGNPTLQNEKLREYEIGLELKFLKNRLSFDGAYFDRKTSDLLTPTPINPSSGFYKYNLNAGSMRDRGFELLVSGTAVRTNNFSWDVDVNFTRIRNKVLKLATGVDKLQFGGFGGGGGVYAFPGLPYGVLYGSRYLRDSAGNVEVDDNGLPIVGPNGIIGNNSPDFQVGLVNNFTWKAFSLGFVFDWRQGGDLFNLDNHYNWFYGTPKATEDRDKPLVVKGVYQSTGKPNTTAITSQAWFQQVSSIDEQVIERATYIKLRSVNIGYTLNKSVLKNAPFRSISINLSGNNLWIYKPHFNGSDPEVSLQGSGNGQGVINFLTPTSRSYILGLRASF
ncbi:TonB-dependent receptor domain-containing protein [Puia sp. P3]|uniref:TonB-dependent receptor domain-containing protein n=1 Tax=Puia sp. P3 TaxID=3423952 RepID=UPI003D66488C